MTASELYFDLRVDYTTRQIMIHGELDAATAACLGTAVAGFQRAAVGDITISLDHVTYLDMTGVGAIASAKSAQAERGNRLEVTGVTEDMRRLFMLAKLADLIDSHDQRAENAIAE